VTLKNSTQLEKQREAAAKAKIAKRATGGLVAKNDGPGQEMNLAAVRLASKS
jgi:hypothetical protein